MDFLPKDYDIPSSGNNYMRFSEQGEHRFRIMNKPILGYEGWITLRDGSKKPVRKRMDEDFRIEEIDNPDEIRHFWAMVVWNYKENRLQVLEITQKTIQKAIKAITQDDDWGNPVGNNGYDIVVTRSGEGFDTEYQVTPKPKKALDKEVVEAYKKAKINVEALYSGDDPFATVEAKQEDVKTDEVLDQEEKVPF